MTYRPILPLILLITIFISCAYADIGGIGGSIGSVGGGIGKIGSPVVPSNLPKSTPAANQDKQKKDDATPDQNITQERTPLLVINFNQKHTYFDHALTQAIEQTEKARAGVRYEVVSRVPSGEANKMQNERANEEFSNNLNAVIQKMLDLGVQSSRIETSTESVDTLTHQEIDIFVD